MLRVRQETECAPLHDVDTMRNPQGRVRELLDQQHADAIRGELPDHRNQPGHDHALGDGETFINP